MEIRELSEGRIEVVEWCLIEVLSSSNGFEIGPDFYSFPPYLVHTLYLKEARKEQRSQGKKKKVKLYFFHLPFSITSFYHGWTIKVKKKYHASFD